MKILDIIKSTVISDIPNLAMSIIIKGMDARKITKLIGKNIFKGLNNIIVLNKSMINVKKLNGFIVLLPFSLFFILTGT